MLLLAFSVQFFDRDRQRNSFISESIRLKGCDRPAVRTQRKLILFFTGDFVFPRDVFSRQAHAQIKIGIMFDQIRIGPNDVPAHRNHRHRFQSAGNNHFSAVGANAIGGHRDRLQSRRTKPIDRHCAGLNRQASANRRRARDVHPLLGFGHRATHDHVFNL